MSQIQPEQIRNAWSALAEKSGDPAGRPAWDELHEDAKLAWAALYVANQVAKDAKQAQQNEQLAHSHSQFVFVDFKQATDLLAMFGGEPAEITLEMCSGHQGPGLYAHFTDYPEEGSVFLGLTDESARPDVEALPHSSEQPQSAAVSSTSDLPMQPLIRDKSGTLRFKGNALVEALYEHSAQNGMSMNDLARMDFAEDHRQQFAQLIGYSVDGYGTLSYVSDDAHSAAQALAHRKE